MNDNAILKIRDMQARTWEIFTEKYSKIIQADTPAEAIKLFVQKISIDELIIAIIDVERAGIFKRTNPKREAK